jgi:hypothetical protein
MPPYQGIKFQSFTDYTAWLAGPGSAMFIIAVFQFQMFIVVTYSTTHP